MKINNVIADIEACDTILQLKITLQLIAENYGFSAFDFVDAGQPHVDQPFHMGTSGTAWESEYIDNGFIHHDPMVSLVRRSNVPFTWSSVDLPAQTNRKRPEALKLMDAANDHGFRDGLVIPVHFRDPLGRMMSCSSVFFWKDRRHKFRFMLKNKKHELNLIMIFWVQCAIDMVAEEQRQQVALREHHSQEGGGPALTPREKDVLSWAARGKTSSETSDILHVSEETINTHLKNSLRKLGAANKTHATVKAIYLGLIDV
jgi:DNA-binding CsgD family transcriptional regulator